MCNFCLLQATQFEYYHGLRKFVFNMFARNLLGIFYSKNLLLLYLRLILLQKLCLDCRQKHRGQFSTPDVLSERRLYLTWQHFGNMADGDKTAQPTGRARGRARGRPRTAEELAAMRRPGESSATPVTSTQGID